MPRPEIQVICRSVFKGGENTLTREQFTRVWAELINRLERAGQPGRRAR